MNLTIKNCFTGKKNWPVLTKKFTNLFVTALFQPVLGKIGCRTVVFLSSMNSFTLRARFWVIFPNFPPPGNSDTTLQTSGEFCSSKRSHSNWLTWQHWSLPHLPTSGEFCSSERSHSNWSTRLWLPEENYCSCQLSLVSTNMRSTDYPLRNCKITFRRSASLE